MSDQYSFVHDCETGDLAAVREAIAAGIAVDDPDILGQTALARACAAGQLEIVRALLEAGADHSRAETDQSIAREACPPLVAAAAAGEVEVVRALLAAGAELESRSSRYRTALAAAAEADELEIMDLLLAAGAEIDQRQGFHGRTALASAAYHKREPSIRALLAAGASASAVDEDGDNALHQYCASVMGYADPDTVRALLAAGAPVDAAGAHDRTALHGAARWNGARLVAVLLEAGADPKLRDASGRTALHGACEAREGDAVVPLLVEAGAEVDAASDEGARPLHLACKTAEVGDVAVRALLDAGAEIDVADRHGQRPLALVFWNMHASDPRTPAKARALLERGADCAGVLDRAARLGDAALVEAIIARGAPLDHTDQWKRTALHWAAHDGNHAVIEALARAGAKLDAADAEGHTPLHLALREQHVEAALALLRAGASSIANEHGHSPLHYAHAETLAALLRARPELSELVARERGETRDKLRCPARAGPARSCDACTWEPSGARALHCPWCGKQAVEISDYEVLQGNPDIPTPNTEVRFTYTCGHCELMFANGWNAMNSASPYLYEVETGASWRSDDGGLSWRRSWGQRE